MPKKASKMESYRDGYKTGYRDGFIDGQAAEKVNQHECEAEKTRKKSLKDDTGMHQ